MGVISVYEYALRGRLEESLLCVVTSIIQLLTHKRPDPQLGLVPVL